MSSFVFLMLSFPLGLLYFCITVIGISVGVGTIVIWVGLPILFITLLCVRGMAEIERRTMSSLLRLPVNYQWREPRAPGRGFLRQFGDILRDPYTWTGMIYMLLKLPLGIINFTVALTLTTLSAFMTILPLVYLVNVLIDIILLRSGVSVDVTSILIPYFVEIHGQGVFDPVMFARSFVGVPIGIVLWIVTHFVLNSLALFSGEIAQALLGPGNMTAQPHQGQYHIPPMETRGQRGNID